MATREARLTEFSQGIPKQNRPAANSLRGSARYLHNSVSLPVVRDGAWRKVGSAKTIEATVIGWRRAAILAIRRAHVRYWG